MTFERAFAEMKRLWEEAEEEHNRDDAVLTMIFEKSTDNEIISAIIKRWAEQGGRYYDGQYYSFKDTDIPKRKIT